MRETRIVAADDDLCLWTKRPNETDERMRGSALERHDTEADNVRRTRPHQVLDGRPDAILGQDQVCDRDPMMWIDVAGERAERAVGHAHRDR